MKTKFFRINIPYRDVKKVVIAQTIYVEILALGFLFHKSLMVGKNPIKVTIPPIL